MAEPVVPSSFFCRRSLFRWFDSWRGSHGRSKALLRLIENARRDGLLDPRRRLADLAIQGGPDQTGHKPIGLQLPVDAYRVVGEAAQSLGVSRSAIYRMLLQAKRREIEDANET